MPSPPNRKRGRSDFVRSLTATSASGGPPNSGTSSNSPAPSPRPPQSQSQRQSVQPSTPRGSQNTNAPPPPSQPSAGAADIETGVILFTTVGRAVSYLKEKKRPISFDDICSYLSLDVKPETARLRPSLAAALRDNPKVQYNPPDLDSTTAGPGEGDSQLDGSQSQAQPQSGSRPRTGPAAGRRTAGGGGTYQFKPKHNIRSAADLIGHLQQQRTAKGLSAKDLKEGWADASTAIDSLERTHQILVARQKKDNAPRTVWLDDPSLKPRQEELDPEFVALWHSFKLPETGEELSKRLEDAGLKATSAAGQAAERARKAKALEEQRAKKKKRGGPRAGGRVTNDHMSWALRNYSHLRK